MQPIPPSAIPPQPSIPPIPLPVPPIIPPPPPKKKSFAWLIIPLLIFILPISGYFVFQINKFKQQLNQPAPTPIPSPVVILPSPSPSLTADWPTYHNQVQNYSFQYPSGWQINEAGATVDINNKLTLTKDNYIITIYANIQGVGGTVRQVPSVPITVAGLNLYKRDIGDNLYDNTGSFEISASDSNPTFKYQDKTYEIYLTYPLAEKGTQAYLANLTTFDLILSTFRFTNPSETQPSSICEKDLQCPTGYFCDVSQYCNVTPDGVECGEKSGSQTCIKSCQVNSDCQPDECIRYTIFSGGDAGQIKKGCKIN